MARLGETFDASSVPEREEFTPVPPGTYTAMITADSERVTKKGGKMIVLELDIMDGEHAGRKLFENLNIENDNPKAVDIAFRTLGEIVKAVGKTTIKDTTELHNKRLYIQVVVDPPKSYIDKDGQQQEGKPSNSIKKFLPVSAAVSTPKTTAVPSSVGTVESKTSESVAPWKRTKS